MQIIYGKRFPNGENWATIITDVDDLDSDKALALDIILSKEVENYHKIVAFGKDWTGHWKDIYNAVAGANIHASHIGPVIKRLCLPIIMDILLENEFRKVDKELMK